MLPQKNVMLKIDRHLVPKHNIYDWDQFTIDRNRHISYTQRPFWVVKFGFRDCIAKHAVTIFFVLVRGSIHSLRRRAIGALSLRWRTIGTRGGHTIGTLRIG